MSAELVGADGGGESKTLEDLFLIIDLSEFFVDLTVSP